MSFMFGCCISLTSIDLSKFDTSDVRNMEGMFFECVGLTSIDVSGFANSEEFFNLCARYGVVCGTYMVNVPNDQQGGVNCFVARLYKVCLNRLPDMGGQAGWVMKLMNGEVTGSTCAYGRVLHILKGCPQVN